MTSAKERAGRRLEGKVAVITGAASGMGWATTHLFMQEGAKVVGLDLNEENGASLIESLSSAELVNAFRFLPGDVANELDVERSILLAADTFGHLDIMFNNAGVGGAFGPITETDVGHWDETFAINTRGVFLGVKHAAKAMVRQGRGGSIINTASVAGLSGGAGSPAYSAAKAAVINFTKNAALEFAPDRIRVNAICPGLIFTPLMHRGREADAEETMRQIQPWPERGEAEHIAHAALYLASDESAFVTGEAHVVDGGYSSSGGLTSQPLIGGRNQTRVGVAYGTTGRDPTFRKLGR